MNVISIDKNISINGHGVMMGYLDDKINRESFIDDKLVISLLYTCCINYIIPNTAIYFIFTYISSIQLLTHYTQFLAQQLCIG